MTPFHNKRLTDASSDLHGAFSAPPPPSQLGAFPTAGPLQPPGPAHAPFIDNPNYQNQWAYPNVSNRNAPLVDSIFAGSGCLSHNDCYDPEFSKEFNNTSGNLWPIRPNQAPEQLWNWHPATFAGLESLPLERIPSLETDLSVRSLSFESPPEVAAIFGASHWPGIFPLAPVKRTDTTKAGENMAHQVEQESDSRSWGLEPQCGSSPGALATVVELSPSHSSPLFDFGIQVAESREQYPFRDHPTASTMFLSNQFECDRYSQVVDREESATGCSFAEHSRLDHANLTPSHLSPSHTEPAQYPRQDPEETCPSTSVGAGRSVEHHPQDHKVSWDCFVVEDGSGKVIAPPFPHRKGTRHGRLPPDKAKVTAERRRQGKTCMRCRVARVEVSSCPLLGHYTNFDTQCDGRDPCQRCTKLSQSATLTSPCIKANFLDIVKSGTCNYICELLRRLPNSSGYKLTLVCGSATRHQPLHSRPEPPGQDVSTRSI